MTIPAESSQPATCDECTQDLTACDMSGCLGRRNPGFRERANMTDSQKLSAILENQVWLSGIVADMLNRFQSSPAFRMMGLRK
jgi:hypothetical protein